MKTEKMSLSQLRILPIIPLFLAIFSLFICSNWSYGDEVTVKKACLEATKDILKKQIELTKTSLAERRESDETGYLVSIEKLESSLKKMKAEYDKYTSITIDEYELPDPIEVEATMNSWKSLRINEEQSMKGPWYTVVGSQEPIEPDKKYIMTIHVLYKLPFSYNHYDVYVSEIKLEE